MIFAAVLAGGIGSRLKVGLPKQFYEINRRPMLTYCIDQFIKVEEFDKIIVSSPKDYLDRTNEIINKYYDDDRLVIIEGGATRNDTILNSIEYAKANGADETSVMVTHDGARIFVTPELIKESIKYAQEYGAASPVIPATDVIFQSKEHGKLTKIPERKYLCHSQTPQSFNIDSFVEIYDDLSDDEIRLLDEAMMLFYLRDKKVYLFDGDSANFKVTRPFDITLAKAILGDKSE